MPDSDARARFEADPESISPRRLFAEVPDRKRRFLLAAVAAFDGCGYFATTTRDICKLAGASPAGMYAHYPSKANVLFDAALISHKHSLATMQAAVDAAGTPTDQMRDLVRAAVLYHAEERLVARVVNSSLAALEPEFYAQVVDLRRQSTALVRTVIEHGTVEGEFDVPDVAAAGIAVLRLVDVCQWFNPAGPASAEELADTFAGMLLKMLT